MTPLRQKMIENMQLRGLSVNTQQAYVQAVRSLALYYHKSPDKISTEELRNYFLYLTNEKNLSRSSCTSLFVPSNFCMNIPSTVSGLCSTLFVLAKRINCRSS